MNSVFSASYKSWWPYSVFSFTLVLFLSQLPRYHPCVCLTWCSGKDWSEAMLKHFGPVSLLLYANGSGCRLGKHSNFRSFPNFSWILLPYRCSFFFPPLRMSICSINQGCLKGLSLSQSFLHICTVQSIWDMWNVYQFFCTYLTLPNFLLNRWLLWQSSPLLVSPGTVTLG